MTSMRRYYLRLHDKSTSGGVVTEGIRQCTIYGIPQTYTGARLYCPTCKSEGRICAKGPRLPETMFGEEPALSDDVCICKCDPPPIMIASQNTDYQIVEPVSKERVTPLAPLSSLAHDEQVCLVDAVTGKPLCNVPYRFVADGAIIESGMTNSEGKTKRVQTNGPRRLTLEIMEAIKRA
jgi:uncharacterized Zn-binding protein involved in type VI secretion